jgi:hypothetical protein
VVHYKAAVSCCDGLIEEGEELETEEELERFGVRRTAQVHRPSDARRDARELGGHRRGCRHRWQSSRAARRRAGKLDARRDKTRRKARQRRKCGAESSGVPA